MHGNLTFAYHKNSKFIWPRHIYAISRRPEEYFFTYCMWHTVHSWAKGWRSQKKWKLDYLKMILIYLFIKNYDLIIKSSSKIVSKTIIVNPSSIPTFWSPNRSSFLSVSFVSFISGILKFELLKPIISTV